MQPPQGSSTDQGPQSLGSPRLILLLPARPQVEQYEQYIDGDNVEVLEDGGHPGAQQQRRITTRYMTKYEKARVLGTRALQIRRVRASGPGQE